MGIRIVPFSISYDAAERDNKIASIFLFTSTTVSIGITSISNFHPIPDLQTTLIVINSAFIFLYLFFDNRANYIFTKAEMQRRLDWLDNSFQTNFSGKKSRDYFTNEHLSPGLYKLAVNCFENSYHTQSIISKMLPSIITKTILIVLAFIFSAYFGNKEIVRLFFELALPAVLIQKLVKAIIYSTRIAGVQDRFKSLFNDLLKHDFDCKTADALRAIIEYETTLSWASTPLSSKIFWKYKDKLAAEWLELKSDYQIKS